MATGIYSKAAETVLASASRTSDDTATLNAARAESMRLFLDVTAATGTSPTLDIDVETQDPASGKWRVLTSFTQATGVTDEMVTVSAPMGHALRVSYTLGGTTPDFTFSLGAVYEGVN